MFEIAAHLVVVILVRPVRYEFAAMSGPWVVPIMAATRLEGALRRVIGALAVDINEVAADCATDHRP